MPINCRTYLKKRIYILWIDFFYKELDQKKKNADKTGDRIIRQRSFGKAHLVHDSFCISKLAGKRLHDPCVACCLSKKSGGFAEEHRFCSLRLNKKIKYKLVKQLYFFFLLCPELLPANSSFSSSGSSCSSCLSCS